MSGKARTTVPKSAAKSRVAFVIPPAEDKTFAEKTATAVELLVHNASRLLPSGWVSNGVGRVFEWLLPRLYPGLILQLKPISAASNRTGPRTGFAGRPGSTAQAAPDSSPNTPPSRDSGARVV